MAADEATPEDVHGYVDPDPGTDSPAESEIPVGVDALTDEQIAKADEAGPAGGEGGGDDDALDVSALMEEGGADDAGDDEPTADDDTGGPDAAEEEA
ncbi:MAG: hypothetical protein Q8K79_04105 [Solirubrobacteraceae bacterium]|nr:hypothetical protein [Solirubrobacteraceae bacterium]